MLISSDYLNKKTLYQNKKKTKLSRVAGVNNYQKHSLEGPLKIASDEPQSPRKKMRVSFPRLLVIFLVTPLIYFQSQLCYFNKNNFLNIW